MPKPPSLADIYQRALSTHELRCLYIDEAIGITQWDDSAGKHIQKTNPFLKETRKGLLAAKRETPGNFEEIHIEIDATISGLDDAERVALLSIEKNKYSTLGYEQSSPSQLIPIPTALLLFATINFDEGVAISEENYFAGLRFIAPDNLSKEEQKLLQGYVPNHDGDHARPQSVLNFSVFGAKHWSDITLRFLKDYFVEIKGPKKSKKLSVDALGLMNKTEQKPNDSFLLLINSAKKRYASTHKKHPISKLRKKLQAAFNTPKDPFSLQNHRYVPRFKVIDDQTAADLRAKSDAVHVPYNDEKRYETSHMEDEYPTDDTMFKDNADAATNKWLKDNDV